MTTSVLRVLTYHRVIDPGHPSAPRPASVSATPAGFDRQMRHLARRYQVVSTQEVLAALWGGPALPPKAVLVTFDDAYRDFGDIAWPILRRHGLPATLFVPTAFPDHPEREFWWDRLHRVFDATSRTVLDDPITGRLPLDSRTTRASSLRALEARLKSVPHAEAMHAVERVCAQLGEEGAPASRVLGWDALRELAQDGVTLAPHTRTHPALSRLPADEARAEIRGSREDLQREIGTSPPIFAYPFGAHDDRVVQLMREEGFELALTCIDGHNRLEATDPLRLRRTNISTRTSPWIFRARLHTVVAYADMWRHRHEYLHARTADRSS